MSWKTNLPMAATTSRFLVAPIIFAVLMSGASWAPWTATILFILGSLTDWLDGYWARLYKCESNMGKFMDPIADKILVLSVLNILIYYHRVDPIAPTILLARDIFIGGLRSVAASNNVIIAAKATGKVKAALQMASIPCLFVDLDLFGTSLHSIGIFGLWLSVVLSILSGVEYTLGYYRGVQQK